MRAEEDVRGPHAWMEHFILGQSTGWRQNEVGVGVGGVSQSKKDPGGSVPPRSAESYLSELEVFLQDRLC